MYNKNGIKLLAAAIIIQAGRDLKSENYKHKITAELFLKNYICRVCCILTEFKKIDEFYNICKEKKLKINRSLKKRKEYYTKKKRRIKV